MPGTKRSVDPESKGGRWAWAFQPPQWLGGRRKEKGAQKNPLSADRCLLDWVGASLPGRTQPHQPILTAAPTHQAPGGTATDTSAP